MKFPENLLYAKSHEWVQWIDDTTARVGLTDFAQDALGDIVFVNLPEVGTEFAAEDDMGEVESVKSVSNIYAPVSGKCSAVNEELLDAPEKINEDPYGAWVVEFSDAVAGEKLLSAAEYQAFVEEEA